MTAKRIQIDEPWTEMQQWLDIFEMLMLQAPQNIPVQDLEHIPVQESEVPIKFVRIAEQWPNGIQHLHD